MTRLVLVLALMMAGATAAHAQSGTAPQATPQPAHAAVAGDAAVPPVKSMPPQMQGQPAAGATPPTAAKAAPPDPQSLMRDLQEQGREAVAKARELQATDPAAANKVMQDYYQMRNEKMREIQKMARTQAADERAKKREDARVKEAAAQAERAAVKRDARDDRNQNADSLRERRRERERERRRQAAGGN